MTDSADFEVSLRLLAKESYGIELRFRLPGSDADESLMPDDAPLQFDSQDLLSALHSPSRYGRELWNVLFGAPKVLEAFNRVRTVAQTMGAPLRIRLKIARNAQKLHQLRWEALHDPATDGSLLSGERILFSRYLTSDASDWRQVKVRARSELRALIVAANPDLSKSPMMKPVNSEKEIGIAKKALARIPVKDVIGTRGEATVENIVKKLGAGYDILYLICHGSFSSDGESKLWLEDKNGQVHRVSGREFVNQLKGLSKLPSLVVLASCESAGTGEGFCGDDEGSLAAIGPSLAEAGIAAVVAMQGQVAMRTSAMFMEDFFDSLQKDGQIDAAMNKGRRKVMGERDWWMPVLFMRLASGRLWYDSGFLSDEKGEGAQKWPTLLAKIRDEECTAIAGPGLAESLLGARTDTAAQLAKEYKFPMGANESKDLAQVAQYVAVTQAAGELQKGFVRDLLRTAFGRLGDSLPDALRSLEIERASNKEVLAALSELTQAAFSVNGRASTIEEYRILARLPFSIYVSTDPSDLLKHALGERKRFPRQILCPWNNFTRKLNTASAPEAGWRPSEKEPLIYQLFGTVNELKSLVLTVDDHFDYLIGVTTNEGLIPSFVRSALAGTSLLFAGVGVEDWNFRILLRTIAGQEGHSDEDEEPLHIAAQITPDESRIRQPDRARKYLQDYLKKRHINIYWGSSEDFLTELDRRWQEKYGPWESNG